VIAHSAVVWAFFLCGTKPAAAGCPQETTIQNFTGVGRVTCPCFVAHEQAGVVLSAPASDYPLEVLRVGIAWGSQFGGTPSSLEQAIHIYSGGLPNPGSPIFSLDGPVLNDGAINQFDLEPLPGQVIINSGPFAVTLEFRTANAGDIFKPSVVHDNNGCQPGKNVVFATPGGWSDACALGVSGDWVFFVVYRPCVSTTTVSDPWTSIRSTVDLLPPRPNPLKTSSSIDLLLRAPQTLSVSISDVAGRHIATLAQGHHEAGSHSLRWDGTGKDGVTVPSGMYFVQLRTPERRVRRTLLVNH
jgi:hypothetical protein